MSERKARELEENIEEETKQLIAQSTKTSSKANGSSHSAKKVAPLQTGSSSGDFRQETEFRLPRNKLYYLLFAFGIFCFLLGFVIGRDTFAGSPQSKNDQSNTMPPIGGENGNESPTPAPSEGGGSVVVNKNLYAEARKLAMSGLSILMNYYGPKAKEQLLAGFPFGTQFGFDFKSGEPKSPANFKRLTDTLIRVLQSGQPLKLGFIGSSVMCGHDNCYYDSFPQQLFRFLNPIFQSATGKPIQIRNACQGGTCGDSFENQVFCIRNMVGEDIDALFYSWTYFEHGAKPIQFHELVTRWALDLPNSPPTFFYNTDGYGFASDANLNNDFASTYEAFGVNYFSLSLGLKQNGVWGGKKWGEVGDGVHFTTREGESVSNKDRQESLGVVFRNWHPGPLGHQFVADLVSYHYLRALVAAIDRIKASSVPIPIRVPEVPPPRFLNGDAYLLKLANMEDAPGCIHFEKSTFGKPQVVIADSNKDILNPYASQVVKLGQSPDAWSENVSPINWDMVPRKDRAFMSDEAACAPPDRCGSLLEPKSGKNTPLVFRLPKMKIGMIVLCTQGKDGGVELKSNIAKFEITFDERVLSPQTFDVFPDDKCLRIQKTFTEALHDASGHLYLKIVANDPTYRLRLSQVIVA